MVSDFTATNAGGWKCNSKKSIWQLWYLSCSNCCQNTSVLPFLNKIFFLRLFKFWFFFFDMVLKVQIWRCLLYGARTHVFVEVHWGRCLSVGSVYGLDSKWCICATWGLTWKNSATYIILASKWCPADHFFGHITPSSLWYLYLCISVFTANIFFYFICTYYILVVKKIKINF